MSDAIVLDGANVSHGLNELPSQPPVLPYLPSELQRAIFELAARTGASYNFLSDIAPHVKNWIEPIYHENANLPGFEDYAKYPDVPSPDTTKAPLLKCLTIKSNAKPEEVAECLTQCYNLQQLTVHREDIVNDTLLGILEMVIYSELRTTVHPFRSLTIPLKKLFPSPPSQSSAPDDEEDTGIGGVDFNHPLLAYLHYLEDSSKSDQRHPDPANPTNSRLLWANPANWVEGNNFGCLTQLRFLKINSIVCIEIAEHILRECGKLEVVAFPGEGHRGQWLQQLPKRRVRMRRRASTCSNSSANTISSDGDDNIALEEEPEDRVLSFTRSWEQRHGWKWVECGLEVVRTRRLGRPKRLERSSRLAQIGDDYVDFDFLFDDDI